MDYLKTRKSSIISLITWVLCFGIMPMQAAVWPSVADSIQMDEVIVTGSRPAVTLRNLPMSVTTISKEQIERRFEPSLLPILTEEVPGLFITGRGVMGYGVASGSAGGMKIRGVGGSPTSAVLVLIDGHPQYMGLMGHPLPDSYQTLMAERVEVVRGPASILYGSNAMGGVINILTKKEVKDGVKGNVRVMYGSFNTVSTEVNGAVRQGKFSSFVALDYNRTDGHRPDMQFGQWSGYMNLGYDFTSHWKGFADLNLTRFSASNPGSTDAPLLDNDALITRGVTSLSLENNYDRTSGALKLFFNFGTHDINNGYTPSERPLDYRFGSKDRMFGASLYQSYRLFRGNQTTLGFDYQRYGGEAWNRYIDRDDNLVDKTLNDVAGYLNIQQALVRQLTLNVGLRVDHNSHSGIEWVPQIGLSYAPAPSTVLKAIVSKGFRNPTIRDMYMFPPQNPDLKPERLMNYELSVSQSLLQNRLWLDLDLYYLRGDNTIQTLPVGGRPLNVNTGRIENYGVEFALKYNVSKLLSLSANYSWLHMEHKVVAAPEHKLYVGVNLTKTRWRVSTGIQYIHNLYTTLAPITAESFVLWNLRASYYLNTTVELFIRGENLLAQTYQINAGYPMPKATAFAGINLKF